LPRKAPDAQHGPGRGGMPRDVAPKRRPSMQHASPPSLQLSRRSASTTSRMSRMSQLTAHSPHHETRSLAQQLHACIHSPSSGAPGVRSRQCPARCMPIERPSTSQRAMPIERACPSNEHALRTFHDLRGACPSEQRSTSYTMSLWVPCLASASSSPRAAFSNFISW